MMTRRHFQSFAHALSFAKPNPQNKVCYEQWLLDVGMVAAACAEHDPRFDLGIAWSKPLILFHFFLRVDFIYDIYNASNEQKIIS